VSRSAETARDTARRSSTSSAIEELTNTRRRRSGVRMTVSCRGPSFTRYPNPLGSLIVDWLQRPGAAPLPGAGRQLAGVDPRRRW